MPPQRASLELVQGFLMDHSCRSGFCAYLFNRQRLRLERISSSKSEELLFAQARDYRLNKSIIEVRVHLACHCHLHINYRIDISRKGRVTIQ